LVSHAIGQSTGARATSRVYRLRRRSPSTSSRFWTSGRASSRRCRAKSARERPGVWLASLWPVSNLSKGRSGEVWRIRRLCRNQDAIPRACSEKGAPVAFHLAVRLIAYCGVRRSRFRSRATMPAGGSSTSQAENNAAASNNWDTLFCSRGGRSWRTKNDMVIDKVPASQQNSCDLH
jgi:hypothetical protein